MGNNSEYSLPAASQVAETTDINSGVITSDPDIDELNKFLDDDDFFEANDLLGPEAFPSIEENPLANIKFDDTYDGLGEWDLFDDTSMFLRETAANDVNSMFDEDYGVVNHISHQAQPQLGDLSFATDELWGCDNQYQDRPYSFPSGKQYTNPSFTHPKNCVSLITTKPLTSMSSTACCVLKWISSSD